MTDYPSSVTSAAAQVADLIAKARALSGHDAVQAAAIAVEAGAIARAAGLHEAQIDAQLIEGQMRANLMGDVATGLDLLKSALLSAEALGDRHRACTALSHIGLVYDYIGDYAQALEHQARALQLAESLADLPLRGSALRAIGVTASKSGDAQLGLRYYEQALVLAKQSNDVLGAVKLLNNIGINLKNLGQLAESQEVIERALAMSPGLGDHILCGLLNNYAETLIRRGDLPAAQQAVERAHVAATTAGYVRGIINAVKSKARLTLLAGDPAAARDQAEAALVHAKDINERSAVAECLELLVDCCKQLQDPAAALAYAEERFAIEREIHESEVTRRLKGMEALHELSRARREADELRSQKEELGRAYRELSIMHDALQAADREKSRLMQELERQSNEDALTGLFNRRFVDQYLQRELARTRRQNRAMAVAMGDIDHFKRINDRWSHAAGDTTLRRIAELMRSQVRAFDVVARYGGEEFVIILADADLVVAKAVCEKLRAAIAALTWPEFDSNHRVTISFGVAGDPGEITYDRLLANADEALYRAKAAGRNCVRE
jgi:diguanylate cyclase (GGDEF)-like protein